MNRYFPSILLLGFLSGCTATPIQWQASTYHDEFTGKATCRVEHGTQQQREFSRAMTGAYITNNFYAESHDGDIRAGVRSEPAIPISGDVQIKVGEKLYTLTARDVPLDIAPSMPAPEGYAETMTAMQKLASPYRAFTGKKAEELLQEIVRTQDEIKFRVVGVNMALSATGAFVPDAKFKEALRKCDIIR